MAAKSFNLILYRHLEDIEGTALDYHLNSWCALPWKNLLVFTFRRRAVGEIMLNLYLIFFHL